MKELIKAIYAKNAGSTLDGLIGGQLFYGRAPAGTRYPYVVFSVISARRDPTFTEAFGDILIQFSAFSADQLSANGVHDILAAIETLYDGYTLLSSTVALLQMSVSNIVGPDADDSIIQDGAEGGWSAHIDFDVLTEI